MGADREVEAFVVLHGELAAADRLMAQRLDPEVVPPEVIAAFVEQARAFQATARTLREIANCQSGPRNPWVLSAPKILMEGAASRQRLLEVLTVWQCQLATRHIGS